MADAPRVELVALAADEDGSDHGAGAGDAHGDARGDGHAAGPTAAFLVGQAGAHNDFFGFDPHKVMYYVSAVVGGVGILVAAFLHGPTGFGGLMLGGRTTAGACRMDPIAKGFGPIPRWAERKWYVDEFYDAVLRLPLVVVSHIFHAIDRVLVDGLVNLAGLMPRVLGGWARPAQSGVLHGYALGMAGGVALILLVVFALVGLGAGVDTGPMVPIGGGEETSLLGGDGRGEVSP